ncbi:hypothetical protein [Neorhizobium sp. T6_25]|uniref:hypothetical protein n=1 Tax=Neorhizobium sp. T6_25 TaxID=2093833 RepID=UPI000CF8E4C1|nr:hypothetical protein [Neorhizobium sp. T6_25]
MPDREEFVKIGEGSGSQRSEPATWEEVFGEKIPDLQARRVETYIDDPLVDEISDAFATVAHHLFRQLDGSEGWPSHARDDIGSFFVRSERQTAVVIQHCRRIAIGLFSGLGVRLLELAGMAVGPCNVFPDAEFIDKPVNGGDTLPLAMVRFWAQLGIVGNRAELGHNIFLQMLEFIVLHELAHVDRGHLEEMERSGQLAFVDEAIAASDKHMRTIARRHRKFEADIWTVQLAVDDFFNRNDGESFDVEQILAQYRITALAWLLTLMALDQKSLSLEAHATRSHPAPVHRGMLLDEALLEVLTRAFETPEHDGRDMLDRVGIELAKVAGHAGIGKGRWWGDTNRKMGLSSFERTASFSEIFPHAIRNLEVSLSRRRLARSDGLPTSDNPKHVPRVRYGARPTVSTAAVTITCQSATECGGHHCLIPSFLGLGDWDLLAPFQRRISTNSIRIDVTSAAAARRSPAIADV